MVTTKWNCRSKYRVSFFPLLNGRLAITLLFGLALPSVPFAKPAQCECPSIECGICEKKVGEDFYSEHCANNQVRSCKRARCSPLEGAELVQCQAEKKGDVAGASAKAPLKGNDSDNIELKQVAVVPDGKNIGVVLVSEGGAFVLRNKTERKPVKVGFRIQENDILETDPKGKVKVMFNDKNTLIVTNNSKIKIVANQGEGDPNGKKTLLHLMYGKVRNKVTQKYDGQKSTFEVKTNTAVAGVRGTDFVTSFDKNDSGSYSMKVETILGSVDLFGRQDVDKKVSVSKGEYASFVVDGIDRDLFSDEEIGTIVSKGYLTPVFKLTEVELSKLVKQTDLDHDEKLLVSENKDPICNAPSATLNQCSWTCRNNPKNEKQCRTDLPNVECVRMRCNANGQWANEYRLPASYHDRCKPEETVVGPCDY